MHGLDLLISSCTNCDVLHILREVCEEGKVYVYDPCTLAHVYITLTTPKA